MDVVILAGGTFPPGSPYTYRWELPVHGHTLFDQAYAAGREIGRVICVGGPSDRQTVPSGSTFLASLSAGLALVDTPSFLLLTADMPDVTAEGLRTWLATCPEADVCYPIVRMEDCEARYPGLRRTALSLREGKFTGGNVALLRTSPFRNALPVLERAYAQRKSPLRLARMVGIDTLLRVAIARLAPKSLPVAELENRVGRFLGLTIRAVVSDDAAIGTDIDSLEQFEAWRRVSHQNSQI